jgi:hypothetical protein
MSSSTSTATSWSSGLPSSNEPRASSDSMLEYLGTQIDRAKINMSSGTINANNTSGSSVNNSSQLTNLLDSDKLIEKSIPNIVNRDPNYVVTFSPLQEWEGYVAYIDNNTFTGHLVDKTAGKKLAEETIDFQIDELSDDNKKLLREGAIFRWSIGYQKVHGTKRKVSEIVFRRLPALTKKDIESADIRATILSESLVH